MTKFGRVLRGLVVASARQLTVGGQAVIEGVMMRGANGWAVAVRRADQSIDVDVNPHVPLARKYPFLKLPILRGAIGLFEMMAIGMKSLEYSAQQAALDDPAEIAKRGGNPANGHHESPGKAAAEGMAAMAVAGTPGAEGAVAAAEGATQEPPMSKLALGLTMAFSISMGLCLFVVVPNVATHFITKFFTSDGKPLLEEHAPVIYNLVSGAVRVCIIVGYIWAISLMPDVKRLFRYHGAEHKAVSAFEAGKELTVDNVRPFTIFHPRCGTTFIAITLMVAIFTFAFLARGLVAVWPGFAELSFPVRKSLLILGHIVIMPLVAGLCFELLRLGGKFPRNPLLLVLITPGYWFQRLTVKQPDDSMIEVAIVSLKEALAIREPALAAESPAAVENVPAAAVTA